MALAAIVLALVAGEIARPTTFHAKRVVHGPEIDRVELDDLPPIVTPALGNIDATFVITGGAMRALRAGADVPDRAVIRIVGWCADPQTRLPGSALLAVFDGRIRLDVTSGYRLSRPDVATYFSDPALRSSGFSVDLPVTSLAAGDHVVRMAIVTSDANAISVFPTIVRFRTAPSARIR
jgi:hypothetical protein